MIFEELIKKNRPEFIDKVKHIANNLGVKPEHLMFVMWFETAHTLNHKIQNKIRATGLIQFMPKTAFELGTSVEELKAMSNLEQLDYVEKYLKRFKGKLKDYVDLYCAVFYPAAVGKADCFRITSDKIAQQNPIFDLNKDLDITKAEIRTALLKQIPNNYREYFQ